MSGEGRSGWGHRLAWLLLPAAGLAADLGSKAAVTARLQEGVEHPVIPGFFNLTLGFNRGAIFGSFTGMPEVARYALFAGASLAGLWYFGSIFLREDLRRMDRVALGLVLGGILGNSLDRLMHRHVVDFLDFVFGGWHYWTFNLADSFIVCGVILYGISLLLDRKPQEA